MIYNEFLNNLEFRSYKIKELVDLADDIHLQYSSVNQLTDLFELFIHSNAKYYIKAGSLQEQYQQIQEIQNYLPIQRKRSSDTYCFQQFSTPLTLSFIAHQLITSGDPEEKLDYYEPSAGTGSLLSFFNKQIGTNELNDFRKNILSIYYPETNQFKAENIHLLSTKKYDRILLNPPFSMSGNKKYNAKTGTLHLSSAFKALKPNGILLAIINNIDFVTFNKYNRQLYSIPFQINCPPESFSTKGTKVDTKIIILTKDKPYNIVKPIQFQLNEFFHALNLYA